MSIGEQPPQVSARPQKRWYELNALVADGHFRPGRLGIVVLVIWACVLVLGQWVHTPGNREKELASLIGDVSDVLVQREPQDGRIVPPFVVVELPPVSRDKAENSPASNTLFYECPRNSHWWDIPRCYWLGRRSTRELRSVIVCQETSEPCGPYYDAAGAQIGPGRPGVRVTATAAVLSWPEKDVEAVYVVSDQPSMITTNLIGNPWPKFREKVTSAIDRDFLDKNAEDIREEMEMADKFKSHTITHEEFRASEVDSTSSYLALVCKYGLVGAAHGRSNYWLHGLSGCVFLMSVYFAGTRALAVSRKVGSARALVCILFLFVGTGFYIIFWGVPAYASWEPFLYFMILMWLSTCVLYGSG